MPAESLDRCGDDVSPVEHYRSHLRGHRKAIARYDAALSDKALDAAHEKLVKSLAAIRSDYPMQAAAIEAATDSLVGAWQDACGALIDAEYHECCRRSLAPRLLDAKRSASKARKRWSRDPKAEAMAAIKAEWLAMRHEPERHLSDAQFARNAMLRYGAVIKNEGSVKNAISRWRRDL